MQRAEDEVAGFRGFNRTLDRLEVAQLTDQNDVGIFTQRRAESGLEAAGVYTNLALRDDALLAGVHELDRILDRDDMIAARPIHEVDHAAQRSALAAAGRAGDQHQPLREIAQRFFELRQPELLGRDDRRRNQPEDRRGTAAITQRVAAKARDAGNVDREVGVVPFTELLAIHFRHRRQQHLFELLTAERRGPGHAHQFTVATDDRWLTDAEMQVAAFLRRERAQQCVE